MSAVGWGEALALPERIGRYRILGQLGKGGMAVLYLGRAEGPGGFERLVAIKTIQEHIARDQAFVEMFLNEARIAARLHHPNVVQTYEVGDDQGRYFIAMDYVNGENLAYLLSQCFKLGKAFPISLATHLVAVVAEALHAAHELKDAKGKLLGVVHRDVSPQNIMVGYDGIGRITDFGVAKAADRLNQTRPGVAKGKVAYMAPEQIGGEPLDRRADIFALGVILWEATVGRRLFKSKNEFTTADRVRRARVPLPTELREGYPKALETIVMKALARAPDERYQSARALAEALRQFLNREGCLIGPPEVELFLKETFPERCAARQEMASRALLEDSPDVGKPLSDGSLSLSAWVASVTGAEVELEDGTATEISDSQPAMIPDHLREGFGPAAVLQAPEVSSPAAPITAPRRTSLGLGAVVVGVLLIGSLGIGLYRSKVEPTVLPVVRNPPAAPGAALALPGKVPLAAAPEPDLVRVEVRTVPVDAALEVDGEPASAPVEWPRDGQVHRLRVSAPGFAPVERALVASEDQALEIELLPEEVPPAPPRKKASVSRSKPKSSKRERLLLGGDDL